MRYVTIAMVCAHVGRGPKAVRRAFKAAGVPMEDLRGGRGLRIAEKDANRFLLKQWPESGPLPLDTTQ